MYICHKCHGSSFKKVFILLSLKIILLSRSFQDIVRLLPSLCTNVRMGHLSYWHSGDVLSLYLLLGIIVFDAHCFCGVIFYLFFLEWTGAFWIWELVYFCGAGKFSNILSLNIGLFSSDLLLYCNQWFVRSSHSMLWLLISLSYFLISLLYELHFYTIFLIYILG